jgi:hypothetical protein
VSIRRRSTVKTWERLGLIDPDQYAYIHGGSSVEPAMVKRQVVEDALFYKKNVAVIDEDLSVAFDSVDRFMKEMSLRRLGVPYELIDYLLEFDRHNVKVVRTAYGDSDGFSVERGCCPQGGDAAAFLFLACQDVKNELTNCAAKHPYQYTSWGGESVDIHKTMYADDNSAYQSKWDGEGMQSYVNAAMLFFGFSGMKLSVDKSSFCWLHFQDPNSPPSSIEETPSVCITAQAWVPSSYGWKVTLGKAVPFKRIEPTEYVTYLGSTQSHTGMYSASIEALERKSHR